MTSPFSLAIAFYFSRREKESPAPEVRIDAYGTL